MSTKIGIGLLGAGYIANWHADAIRATAGVRLVGVHDLSRAAAETLASGAGLKVFSSLDEMLGADIDSVHVLTPPPTHFELAKRVIAAGKHAFVEKPMALKAGEARALEALAAARGVRLGVNHNFLMLPGYGRLRADIARGAVGPIDTFEARWRFPLEPMRAGPFGLWMLRRPENVLFEVGPHLFAFVADLFDAPAITSVELRYPIETPDGLVLYQGWRIGGRAGETAIALDLSFVEGHDDRSIETRGLGGLQRFDFAADAYRFERAPAGGIVLGPLAAQASIGAQAIRTGIVNAARQVASLNRLAPYGLGMTRAVQSFYGAIAAGTQADRRLSPYLATRAATLIEEAVALAAPKFASPRSRTPSMSSPAPAPRGSTMLVIGGTGFIGRRLVAALADAGCRVRVFSRGAGGGFGRADGRVEVVTGDLKSERDLRAAMEGVAGVFHLARAVEKTWEGYLDNDVAVTERIGECCVKAGVPRLVYAGTIDSYDASRADRPITEETPFEHLDRRNLYARSKAACEGVLNKIAGEKGLPLVIVRPGIVIGRGGPLRHWGIAMWHGPVGARLWGRGDNPLPFVDLDDCVSGFVLAMTTPGIEGRSFNLVGEPLLSARDYFEEVGKAYGVAMGAQPTPVWRFYVVDVFKYLAKRGLARKRGLAAPSYRDWKSRAQRSPYSNAAAKEALGWRPEADRARFVQKAIIEADLFGFPPSGRTAEDAAAAAPAVSLASSS